MAYPYLDLVLNPIYGTTTAADATVERATGMCWTARWHAWQAATTPAPRHAYAVFGVEHAWGPVRHEGTDPTAELY